MDKTHSDAIRLVQAMKNEIATMDENINTRALIRAAGWLMSGAMALTPNMTPKIAMDLLVDEIDAVFQTKLAQLRAEAN